MSGCWTCGGFGGHHDPIAHDWVSQPEEEFEELGFDEPEAIDGTPDEALP